MKKISYLIVAMLAAVMFASCSSSSSASLSTPDGTVVKYYEYIIKNDVKCLDLMALRFIGGTERERAKYNAEIDEKIKQNNGDLARVFALYIENGSLYTKAGSRIKSVEIIPTEKGAPYYETESRLLPGGEAAEVKAKLTFEDGSTMEVEHVALKIDGSWKI